MAPPKKWADEEESSDAESVASSNGAPAVPSAAISKKKWDDEESDGDDLLDSWDAADDSEEERKKATKAEAAKAKAAAEALANKKSKTQRIEEKKSAHAAEALARALADGANDSPAERRERQRLYELEADMKHAEDLFGSVGIGAGSGREKKIGVVDAKDPSKSIDLGSLDLFNPNTKAGFEKLREVLVPLFGANVKKPHYAMFLQDFVRAIAKDLPSEQIRKVASGLTTLANEKQKEEKAAQQTGKKKKAAPKVALGGAGKETSIDTTSYDNDYDDGFDDFM